MRPSSSLADLSSAPSVRSVFSLPVQRSNQLEALRLDHELYTLLLNQLTSTLRFFPASYLDIFKPELQAALRLFIFANTVAADVPSPGNHHQNLKYAAGSNLSAYDHGAKGLTWVQKVGLLSLDVGLFYFWVRLRRFMAEKEWAEYPRNNWRYVVWRTCNAMESTLKIVRVMNFVLFLLYGKYRSLADRVCRANLLYENVQATRSVSFEFLNRQLVWEGFAEFMLFLAPVMNTERLTQWIAQTRFGRRIWSQSGSRSESSARLERIEGPTENAESSESLGTSHAELGRQKHRTSERDVQISCGICKAEPPTMPHYALPCRHLFCYVCLAVALEDDPQFQCSCCNMLVHRMERLGNVGP